jgi:chromosome segregation ATPase
MANLAMFIAINFILETRALFIDEIDAHLDQDNLSRLATVFQKLSEKHQVTFITHKHFLYKQADVLIGITKDHETNSATCFSYDNKTNK